MSDRAMDIKVVPCLLVNGALLTVKHSLIFSSRNPCTNESETSVLKNTINRMWPINMRVHFQFFMVNHVAFSLRHESNHVAFSSITYLDEMICGLFMNNAVHP